MKIFDFLRSKNKNKILYNYIDIFKSSQENDIPLVDVQTFYNNPIVRQCIDLIVGAVQRVPLVLYKDDEPIDNFHDLFNADKLSEDSIIVFKQKLIRNYILYGRVKLAVARRDVDSVFIKAKILDSSNNIFKPAYDEDTGELIGYTDDDDNHILSFHSFLKSKKKNVDFIAEWKNIPLSGRESSENTYLEVLSPCIDTMAALTKRGNNLVKGAYNTRYLVTLEDTSNSEAEDLRKIVKDSKTNDQFLIVNGSKLNVHHLDNTISNVFDKISTDDIKRTIAGVFGVPVALISPSNADGAKYASNYEESRVSFYEDTIIPKYLSVLEEFLSNILFPPEYKLYFDLNSIDCLSEKRIRSYALIDQLSFLTDDEKRKMAGL